MRPHLHITPGWEWLPACLLLRRFSLRGVLLVLCLPAAWAPPAFGQATGDRHGAFTIDVDCSDCHRAETWTTLRDSLRFDHSRQTRFPLTGAHTTVTCTTCHLGSRFDAPNLEPNDCASCHVDIHLGEFSDRCVDCHSTTSFQDVEGRALHNQTRFPLTGAHAQISCQSCHRTEERGAFSVLDTDCASCHEPDYEVAHGTAGFPTTCESCHTTLAWAATPPFDHPDLSNGFALLGAHESLACTDCHRETTFEPIFATTDPDDCYTCHQQDYEQQHTGTDFPTTCTTCHGTESWGGLTFDHAAFSNGFDLVGAHTGLDCAACHNPPPDFTPTFTPADEADCLTCHESDYQQQHAADGYPTTCLSCHNTDDWDDATVDHSALSNGFDLIGTHDQLPCLACHAPPPGFEPLFNPQDQDDCLTCHQPNYEAAHAGAGFPTTCLSCHNTDEWDDATVDHSALSGGFNLVGAHSGLDCAACHAPPPGFEPLFNPQDQDDCLTCHQNDYQQQHAADGFPTTCLNCHNTDDWDDATVDHSALSNSFDLVGAHTGLDCAACHGPPPDLVPLFNPQDQDDCLTCHQPNYEAAHAGTGFPTTCLSCHNTDEWDDAVFNHSTIANGYALVGTHDQLPCLACHAPPPGFEPLFNPQDQDDCLTCHQNDYQQQHAGSSFPTTCQSCHDNNAWDFEHTTTANGFPLIGAHDAIDCFACHAPDLTPLFNPLDENDCYTCHETEYQQQHGGSGFPTTCLTCHNTDEWPDATFDHAAFSNGFDLVGAHVTLPCSACHGPPPDLEPLFHPQNENDCYTCHEPDYQQQHGAEGYPTTCLSCHNNNNWQQTNFNHDSDYFPIFNGRHEDEWNTCMDCHTDPGNFTLFSCIDCHEHNRPDTDDDHDEVSGYVYQSTACFSCHPTGED